MAKTRLIQIRIPEDMLRKIDRLLEKGMYRSRSEFILDATRRFIEKSMPSSPLESFIHRYLMKKVKPTRESEKTINELFRKVQADVNWRKRFGETPEEVMDKLRKRPT